MISVSKRDRLVSSLKRIVNAVKAAVSSIKAIKLGSAYLTKTGFTGGSSCTSLVASFWIKPVANDFLSTNPIYLINSNWHNLLISVNPSKTVEVGFRDSGGNNAVIFYPSALLVQDQWNHIAVSATFSAPRSGSVSINRVVSGPYNGGEVNASFNFTSIEARIGTKLGALMHGVDGGLAEIAVWAGQTLDLNVPANLEKLIKADGKPADLGADGSATGLGAAIIYLKSDAANYTVNSGTGGDFTLNGSGITDTTGPA